MSGNNIAVWANLRHTASGLPRPPAVDNRLTAPYLANGMASLLLQRQKIIEVGRRLAGRRLVAGSEGNISARTDQNQILVTPSGQPLGSLKPDDLPLVSRQGNRVEGILEPTSELKMHLFVYESRPDVGAVVHAHAPYATAFATAGMELQWDTVPELVVMVGPVPLTTYATPGTHDVPESLEPYIADHQALLLRNHGLVTLGRTLEEAGRRLEVVEHAAQILYHCHQLGGPGSIPAEDLERLNQARSERQKEGS